MLLWTNLLCLFSANLVASQLFPPEVFAGYDPHTVLQPMNDGLESKDSSDNVRVIRALLVLRQSGCPTGYAECTSLPGRLAIQFPFFSPHSTRALVVVICLPFHDERA